MWFRLQTQLKVILSLFIYGKTLFVWTPPLSGYGVRVVCALVCAESQHQKCDPDIRALPVSYNWWTQLTQGNLSENTHPIRLRPGPIRLWKGLKNIYMILMGGKRDPRGRIAQSVKDNVIKILWTWTRGWVSTWRVMSGQLEKGGIPGRIRGELEVGSISGLTLCKSGKLTNNFWLYCLKKGVTQIPLRGGSCPTLLLVTVA